MSHDEQHDEILRIGPCPKCHTQIHVWADETGLLPDECDGDRRATHSWLVCELHQRINALLQDKG